MPISTEGKARISAAVSASNKRRGEQNPIISKAKRKFTQQRANAKNRNVAWSISFVEWWRIWQTSGKWGLRGRGSGRYCMSRFGDSGAYEVGNVFINLFNENTSEGVTGIKRTSKQNADRSAWMTGNLNSLGRRWMSRNGQSRAVTERMIEVFLVDGWVFGRQSRVRNSELEK